MSRSQSHTAVMLADKKRERREARHDERFDRITAALINTDSTKFAARHPTRVIPDVPGIEALTKMEVKRDVKDIEKHAHFMEQPIMDDEDALLDAMSTSISTRPSPPEDTSILRKYQRLTHWMKVGPERVQEDLQFWSEKVKESHATYHRLDSDREDWFHQFEYLRKIFHTLLTEVTQENVLRKQDALVYLQSLVEEECNHQQQQGTTKQHHHNNSSSNNKKHWRPKEMIGEYLQRERENNGRYQELQDLLTKKFTNSVPSPSPSVTVAGGGGGGCVGTIHSNGVIHLKVDYPTSTAPVTTAMEVEGSQPNSSDDKRAATMTEEEYAQLLEEASLLVEEQIQNMSRYEASDKDIDYLFSEVPQQVPALGEGGGEGVEGGNMLSFLEAIYTHLPSQGPRHTRATSSTTTGAATAGSVSAAMNGESTATINQQQQQQQEENSLLVEMMDEYIVASQPPPPLPAVLSSTLAASTAADTADTVAVAAAVGAASNTVSKVLREDKTTVVVAATGQAQQQQEDLLRKDNIPALYTSFLTAPAGRTSLTAGVGGMVNWADVLLDVFDAMETAAVTAATGAAAATAASSASSAMMNTRHNSSKQPLKKRSGGGGLGIDGKAPHGQQYPLALHTFVRSRTEKDQLLLYSPISIFENYYLGYIPHLTTMYNSITTTTDSTEAAAETVIIRSPEQVLHSLLPSFLWQMENEIMEKCHLQSCLAATNLKYSKLKAIVSELQRFAQETEVANQRSLNMYAQVQAEDNWENSRMIQTMKEYGLVDKIGTMAMAAVKEEEEGTVEGGVGGVTGGGVGVGINTTGKGIGKGNKKGSSVGVGKVGVGLANNNSSKGNSYNQQVKSEDEKAAATTNKRYGGSGEGNGNIKQEPTAAVSASSAVVGAVKRMSEALLNNGGGGGGGEMVHTNSINSSNSTATGTNSTSAATTTTTTTATTNTVKRSRR